jgi:hypothetical protein
MRFAASPVRTAREIDQAMTAASGEQGSSLIVLPDAFTNTIGH